MVRPQGLRVVKLNDFGLSRTLSTLVCYRKTSDDKIPAKWMAPECLIDNKYSSASDVWSFGILCWEVFEHGKTPYPDVQIANVLNYLLRGNRMSKPAACPDALYDVMLQCWLVEISARPSFDTLVSVIQEVFDDEDQEEESRL